MNKQETKEYLKTINFGLKDIEKTTQKYKDYKNDKFLKLIKILKLNYSNSAYLNTLEDSILKEFNNSLNSFYKDLDYTKKSNIRMLKTFINGLAFSLNREYLKDYCLNNNMNKNFTIKFYIQYYKKINDSMKRALIKIVELRVLK